MALTATMNAAQTELTTVCDSRIHPAQAEVTEEATITIVTKHDGIPVETKDYSYTRIIKPAEPQTIDEISATDNSGRVWTKFSDDGVTAVFR